MQVDANQWLKEAKAEPAAKDCGMFLLHNGIVRKSAKAQVREGVQGMPPVQALELSYDPELLEAAIQRARQLPGVQYVRVWLNQGLLQVGDDMMYVLLGADIRPRCIDALQALVSDIKTNVVCEREILAGEQGSQA